VMFPRRALPERRTAAMFFSLSILIAWTVTRLRADLPESRTDGSGNPHRGAPPPRRHSH